MRCHPITAVSALLLFLTASLFTGCDWEGSIYLDEGMEDDTTTTSEQATSTDTGSGSDTGEDTETGTDTGTGTEEAESDSGSEFDDEWYREHTMLLRMSYSDYRNNDAPDDQICAYLFPDSFFPDLRKINVMDVDFSEALAQDCKNAEFDEQYEFESKDYFFRFIFEENQLTDLGELGVAIGVLYSNGETSVPPVPGRDYWGYTAFTPSSAALYDPNPFQLWMVPEPPPDDGH